MVWYFIVVLGLGGIFNRILGICVRKKTGGKVVYR